MYSKIFQIVEIDSSFYRIPERGTIKHWKRETPDDFLFTAKFGKTMTADKNRALKTYKCYSIKYQGRE